MSLRNTEGWLGLLALEPGAIAQMLEDQRRPLLRDYYQNRPFRRPQTEEEYRRVTD